MFFVSVRTQLPLEGSTNDMNMKEQNQGAIFMEVEEEEVGEGEATGTMMQPMMQQQVMQQPMVYQMASPQTKRKYKFVDGAHRTRTMKN